MRSCALEVVVSGRVLGLGQFLRVQEFPVRVR